MEKTPILACNGMLRKCRILSVFEFAGGCIQTVAGMYTREMRVKEGVLFGPAPTLW